MNVCSLFGHRYWIGYAGKLSRRCVRCGYVRPGL